VLAIQGFDDEYGTMAQLDAIAGQTGGPIELLAPGRLPATPRTATSPPSSSRRW